MMPCSWEGNGGFGVALAMRRRIKWFIHLRTHGLRKGDEYPACTPRGVWHCFGFDRNLPVAGTDWRQSWWSPAHRTWTLVAACWSLGQATAAVIGQTAVTSEFASTAYLRVWTSKADVAADFRAATARPYRNRSGRPSGCQTSNLTNNDFYVHIISTLLNVK